MPIPTPNKGEDKDDYISRCVSFLKDEDPDMDNKQAVAICHAKWRKSKG